ACTALNDLERTINIVSLGKLTHADGCSLGDRHLQAHLVLLEVDDEEFQLMSRNFLLFNGRDLADAVSRVHDELARLEAVFGRGFLLLGYHTPCTPSFSRAIESAWIRGRQAGQPTATHDKKAAPSER